MHLAHRRPTQGRNCTSFTSGPSNPLMCNDADVPLSSGREDQVRLADHTFDSGSSGICGLPFRVVVKK
jgi:hypothetical protein